MDPHLEKIYHATITVCCNIHKIIHTAFQDSSPLSACGCLPAVSKVIVILCQCAIGQDFVIRRVIVEVSTHSCDSVFTVLTHSDQQSTLAIKLDDQVSGIDHYVASLPYYLS